MSATTLLACASRTSVSITRRTGAPESAARRSGAASRRATCNTGSREGEAMRSALRSST
jgi:hypothetical protein